MGGGLSGLPGVLVVPPVTWAWQIGRGLVTALHQNGAESTAWGMSQRQAAAMPDLALVRALAVLFLA